MLKLTTLTHFLLVVLLLATTISTSPAQYANAKAITEVQHSQHEPRAPKLAPKVLFIANTYEFSFLSGYNFSETFTGSLLNASFACTKNHETCMLNVGQEIRCAMNIVALQFLPTLDLTHTYVIITGTGGVNPKHGTAGGVAISRFSVQWEWGGMFLGHDLPANFSGQYFYSYAQDLPSKYPYLVGTEVYELNDALVDRFYGLAKSLKYEDVDEETRSLRGRYTFAAARRSPYLARCDVVSAQVYWHGDVAAQNVEYYTNLVTNGTATYCNTNEDDQGRLAALFQAALYKKIDFSRIAVVKAFSNFDRPPPGMSAYVSRFLVGETANVQGLENAWKAIKVMAKDVIEQWDTIYSAGITPTNYIGDPCGSLGGIPDFGLGVGSC